MQEFDQYRIELSGEDTEAIVKDHMTKLLAEKGYALDYSTKDGTWPDTAWRGVKTPNVELTGSGQVHRPESSDRRERG